MVTIDRAKPADQGAILSISARIEGFDSLDQACIKELWEAYAAQEDESGYRFIVARSPQQTVGYACFGPTPLTKDVWDLYWLAVDPGQQRHGAGRALMAAIERVIVAERARMLLIETSSLPSYMAARRFYEFMRLPFPGRDPRFYSVGNELLIFGKRFPLDRPSAAQ